MNLWQHLEGSDFKKIRAAIKEAWDAGAWIFVVTKDEIVALEKPVIHAPSGQFHSETGPAVSWPGEQYYFWRGVRIPDSYVIEHPETITIADIDKERNQEVKRVKIERYGYERFMKDGGATKVAEDEYGVLWHRMLLPRAPNRRMTRGQGFQPGDGDYLAMVEVVNGTPEPDGSIKHYWLRVPPDVRTAKEAVAWTYGLTADQYNPVVRT